MTNEEAAAVIEKIRQNHAWHEKSAEALQIAKDILGKKMVPADYHERTLLLEVRKRINAERIIRECLERKKPAAALIITFCTGILGGLALFAFLFGTKYRVWQLVLFLVSAAGMALEIRKL